jgi:hypothetical protein
MREADRFAVLGLVGAVLLAGAAVDWGWRHARAVVAAIAVLAVLEAGWPGNPHQWIMPTTMPGLDNPIAADHSGSIVVDVPFGLRGGLPLQGRQFAVRALLIATADGHPRAVSYTSWRPAGTISGIRAHPFCAQLLRAQRGVPAWPGRWADGETITRAQLAAAASTRAEPGTAARCRGSRPRRARPVAWERAPVAWERAARGLGACGP